MRCQSAPFLTPASLAVSTKSKTPLQPPHPSPMPKLNSPAHAQTLSPENPIPISPTAGRTSMAHSPKPTPSTTTSQGFPPEHLRFHSNPPSPTSPPAHPTTTSPSKPACIYNSPTVITSSQFAATMASNSQRAQPSPTSSSVFSMAAAATAHLPFHTSPSSPTASIPYASFITRPALAEISS